MNQEFIWDINRCSNINPIVDRKTIILASGGKWDQDQFCHAIRRDLKVSDDTAYGMSTEFVNLSGVLTSSGIPVGHLGFAFNFWDDMNYDFVYKRYYHILDENSLSSTNDRIFHYWVLVVTSEPYFPLLGLGGHDLRCQSAFCRKKHCAKKIDIDFFQTFFLFVIVRVRQLRL